MLVKLVVFGLFILGFLVCLRRPGRRQLGIYLDREVARFVRTRFADGELVSKPVGRMQFHPNRLVKTRFGRRRAGRAHVSEGRAEVTQLVSRFFLDLFSIRIGNKDPRPL